MSICVTDGRKMEGGSATGACDKFVSTLECSISQSCDVVEGDSWMRR